MTMQCHESSLEVRTADGLMPVYVARPTAGGPYPIVVVYMDVNGIRDELKRFTLRFASAGLHAVLPDFYYRLGSNIAFDHRTPIHERSKQDIERVVAVMNSLTDDMVIADSGTLIATLRAQQAVHQGPAGCVGYCMGGRHVVRVMTALPQLFAAGSAHYPTHVVTDAADAPYRQLARARGRFYFCMGDQDWLLTPAVIAQLRDALENSGSRYELKIHAGAGHGYSFPEKGVVYNHEAAEYDWSRTIELFHTTL
jgi:carboxymethylenebutenolidase